MTPELVLTIGKQALLVTVMFAAPMLLSALAVGLIISIFQAATQVNEMTLTLIPKLMVLVAVMYIAGPWMLMQIVGFARRLYQSIPSLIG